MAGGDNQARHDRAAVTPPHAARIGSVRERDTHSERRAPPAATNILTVIYGVVVQACASLEYSDCTAYTCPPTLNVGGLK